MANDPDLIHNPSTGEWNESLLGDYLWTNANFGEAVSGVMTPLTWSMLADFRTNWASVGNVPPFGNIAGRLYYNISYTASVLHALGKRQPDILLEFEDTLYTPLPGNAEIPMVDYSLAEKALLLVKMVGEQLRWAQIASGLPEFVQMNPGWCRDMRRRLEAAEQPDELRHLWLAEIQGQSSLAYLGVLSSAMRFSRYTSSIRKKLKMLLNPDDADALISNLSQEEDVLASLGPLVGLEQVVQGRLTQDEYIEAHGHRESNEWELATPRLIEQPEQLNARLAKFQEHSSQVNIEQLIAHQRDRHQAAWKSLQTQHPRQAKSIRPRLAEVVRRGRLREAARSEIVRVVSILRFWALKAGELGGLGDGDVFYLYIDELLDWLSGKPEVLKVIPQRKRTYQFYKSLPAYPSVIRGHFTLTQLRQEPHPASSIPMHASPLGGDNMVISGSPGSAGRIEGVVRVIHDLDEAGALQNSEILVTSLTDIGWTPYFPRAKAIITDIGAALSHAAIVARELGIPAVVGCGNATQRLKSGDRVLVDGGRGIVTILNSKPSDTPS